MKMTFSEFMKAVLTAFPDAEIGEDNDRQLVIYTNMMVDPDTEAAHPDDFNKQTVIPFEDA